MLYAGHIHRASSDSESMRDTTWKEVIHKARVRLMRVPFHIDHHDGSNTPLSQSIEYPEEPMTPGEGSASEFSYHLEIIEDFDDDRMHSFEDSEVQPGPYKGVRLAGIREYVPIHQISKIFYADTGKILNIGGQGETNNPVLLVKRDINAIPPRRMMQENERSDELHYEDPEETSPVEEEEESQDDIDQQLRRESSVQLPSSPIANTAEVEEAWKFPADLDTEWMALEVYTEAADSDSEDGHDPNDDSAYASHRPSSSGEGQNLSSDLSNLNLNPNSSPTASTSSRTISHSSPHRRHIPPTSSPFGAIRSSLSLLEMLIRLTSLQQFQQASHLSITDELLTFFLEESSTTGAGGDGDERRRTRREARRKVGFDPYDESPVKRRGEEYQYQHGQEEYRSRSGTPYEERQYGSGSPEPWLSSRENSSPREMPPSSPVSPYRPVVRKGTGPLDRYVYFLFFRKEEEET